MKAQFVFFSSLALWLGVSCSFAFTWQVLDNTGKIVFASQEATFISDFSEGVLLVQNSDALLILDERMNQRFSLGAYTLVPFGKKISDRIPVRFHTENRKFGYIDGNGEAKISGAFDYAENFINGYAVVELGDTSGPPPHSFVYGMIDRDGNLVLPIEYDFISISHSDNGRILCSRNGISYVIDVTTGLPISNRLGDDFVFSTSRGSGERLVVRDISGFLGFTDWDGRMLLSPRFSAIWSSTQTHSLVWNGGNGRSLVDMNGNEIVIDRELWNIFEGGFISYIENDMFGVIDMQNRVVLPAEYDSIDVYSEGVFVVSREGKYGYVTDEGVVLRSIEYSLCRSFHDGLAICSK